ncbi:MAG: hypothetical protein ABMA64_31895 [Myxococcota bacterium]
MARFGSVLGLRAAEWVVLAVGVAGCDPSIRQVGPGTGFGNTFDTGTSAGWACDQRAAQGQCWEYTGPGWDEASAVADCGGPVVSGSCPGTDALGGCVGVYGAALERVVWYYAGTYYAEDDDTFLRSNCELNLGTWIGGATGG